MRRAGKHPILLTLIENSATRCRTSSLRDRGARHAHAECFSLIAMPATLHSAQSGCSVQSPETRIVPSQRVARTDNPSWEGVMCKVPRWPLDTSHILTECEPAMMFASCLQIIQAYSQLILAEWHGYSHVMSAETETCLQANVVMFASRHNYGLNIGSSRGSPRNRSGSGNSNHAAACAC